MRKELSLIIIFLSLFVISINAQIPPLWTLSMCIDYALKENIQIRKSKIALRESLVDTETAKAALFPSLSFSTSHNYTNRPFLKDPDMTKNSYTGSYGLNASYTLWNGGRRMKTIEQQKLYDRISELNVVQSENSIEENILQVYLQILYAIESVRINENALRISQAQVEKARELLNVGSIARSDLAQLEAQFSNDKYMLITSEATLQTYKLQLKQLLELEGEGEINIAEPAIDELEVLMPLPAKMEVYASALAYRPEIESSRIYVETSDMDIDIARAAYWPTISMSAGLGTGHSTGSDFTFSEQLKNSWNESIGISLSLPIFNNRQTKSTIQKAKLIYQDNQLSLINEQKNLFNTIEVLWLDASTAQQRYLAAKEKLNSSQISFDLVNEQFNLGLKNTVELLTEKNNLLSAQQEILQSKYMAVLNIQLLRFYRGEPIEL